MWCVIISGLPLGVTPSALQRACEEALDDRPVWPQSPKIVEDEALIYVQAKDIQQKLAAKSTKLRVGGIIVNVKKVTKEEKQKWINDRKPVKKKNPAPGSNIHQYLKKQKKEQRKINKRQQLKQKQKEKEEEEIIAKSQQELLSLNGVVPILSTTNDTDNPNKIIWYQYLIFDKYTNNKPFYVTYPALWSWDIEGQWIKFQQEYAMNSSEAEKNHSKFKIGQPGNCGDNNNNNIESSQKMIGDLLNMKVIDTITNNEYDLKRTDKLIGTLINYGQIEFIRYHNSKEKEIFLYDRKTGYDDVINIENEYKELEIGDKVIFEAYWNKDDNDELIHNFTNNIDINKIISSLETIKYDYILHEHMIAFNVRKSSPEDEEVYAGLMDQNYQYDDNLDNNNLNDDDLDKQLNPLLPKTGFTDYIDIATGDPLIAEDFRGQRFEGLVISLRRDETGLIVCFPYNDDERYNKDMTLLFHKRFLRSKSDKTRLTVNMNVEFNIGVHPGNFGQGLYGYVAQDIIITKHGFSNKYMPISDSKLNKTRKYRGKIVIAPKSSLQTQCGWIYNEFDNNMCSLIIDSDEEKHDYRIGMYVRYNEKKLRVNQNQQQQQTRNEDYIYTAFDILPIQRFEEKIWTTYLRSDNFVKYKAKRYISGRKLKIDEDRNIEFKIIKINKENKYDFNNYTDFFLIIEQAELYVNAFLNTCGGAIFFGIKDNGQIIGQNNMTKNKRDYIRNAIGQRLHHFKPSVPSEYYNVEFKEIIDINGYIIPDTFVIIIHVAKLFAGDNIKQHVKFLTSQGEAYERRITSVGFSKSKELTHLKPQQHQELYNKRKAKGITREVNFGVKPRFDIFDGIDANDDNNDNNDNDDNKNINNDDDNDNDDDMLKTMTREANTVNSSDQIIFKDADEGKGQFEQILGHNDVEITMQQQSYSQSMSDMMDNLNISSPTSSYSINNDMGMNMNMNTNMNMNMNMISIPEPLQYTTPNINSLPIPPNSQSGLATLAQRVQEKLSAMMMVTEYMLDPRWNNILTMAANSIYTAQKSTWLLLNQLEREKIQQRTIERAKAIQQKTLYSQRQKQQQQQQQHNIQSMQQTKVQTYADRIARSPVMIPTDNMEQKATTTTTTTTTTSTSTNIDGPTIGEQYKKNFSGSGITEPTTDRNGLPILPDKSKYKAVAMEYCQKMGWKRPVEAAQMYGAGYRATVTFGRHGKEKSESGDGLKQKAAIYEAYIKLIPKVIPKSSAIELMIKWVPGYKKTDKVSTATIGQSGQSIMKHPKSVLLEWAQKNSIAPPKTVFSEYADSTRNLRIWTAKVTFCGKTIEAKGAKKKDAETKCFQEILKHVMNGGIKSK